MLHPARLPQPPPALPYPPGQLWAADVLGEFVAKGFFEHDDCMRDLTNGAIGAGYADDQMGLRLTLSWRLRDAAERWRLKRDKVERLIAWKVGELIEARRPSAELIRAAEAINAKEGLPLLPREVVALVREHVARYLRRIRTCRGCAMRGGFRHAA